MAGLATIPKVACLFTLLAVPSAFAFSPIETSSFQLSRLSIINKQHQQIKKQISRNDPLQYPAASSKLLLMKDSSCDSSSSEEGNIVKPNSNVFLMTTAIALAAITWNPEIASATAANAPNVIGSALAAYGHYVSILGLLACVTVERLTIKPGMSPEEEDLVAITDILYGVFGLLIVYTGYLRVTEFGKGWEFYSHEPLFWLKIAFVGIFGASSFFNTTNIILRSVKKAQGKELEPMSEALANRMIQICDAEIAAIATIPLTATFMARGVGYSTAIPWEGEAALAALVFAGLSFKYIKEALTFGK